LQVLQPCLHPSYWSEEEDNVRLEKSTRLIAGYLAEHLSKDPVDAIMAATDGEVSAVAGACRLLGKEPNRDVLIVGYDHYWEDILEREFEPTAPLATVDKRNHDIGAELVRLLQERIGGSLPAEPQCRVVPSELLPLAIATS
jgi:DNA-binding LacI/PurR family transcriptional regulator